MQNHLIPTTKEWKVIEEALEYLKKEYNEFKYLKNEDKENLEIAEQFLNIIQNRDVLNDKF